VSARHERFAPLHYSAFAVTLPPARREASSCSRATSSPRASSCSSLMTPSTNSAVTRCRYESPDVPCKYVNNDLVGVRAVDWTATIGLYYCCLLRFSPLRGKGYSSLPVVLHVPVFIVQPTISGASRELVINGSLGV
jgi:hypothetical protein